jgi:hypothetical protein
MTHGSKTSAINPELTAKKLSVSITLGMPLSLI